MTFVFGFVEFEFDPVFEPASGRRLSVCGLLCFLLFGSGIDRHLDFFEGALHIEKLYGSSNRGSKFGGI